MITHTMQKVLCAAALIALPFSATAADKVRFQTDWLPSGEHAMFYGGWQKGIYAAEGIDVTITRGYGSGDTVTKLAGGAADFGIADLGAVLTARARANVPVKAIAINYQFSPHSLFVLKSSGITNFKQIQGKKVSTTPGNSHQLYFPKVAELAGADPSKITWVNMDGAAMAAQLIAKNIDAAPFYSIHHYYQNKAAVAAKEEIVVLPFVETGFAIYAATVIATDKMIAEKPDLTKRFLLATRKAYEWANANPEEACKAHVEKVPEVALDDCIGSVKATTKFVFTDYNKATGYGKETAERLNFTWQVVAESQNLDKSWNPAQAVDTSLLTK
ncbi:ABC transporter substrate-binding protein [Ferrovibrio terrae]|uniref:ABC transporter substrate-binding protein n=1 Tax=Ferrovibrio terrae TaxID=2594003 RepID=UPI003137AFE8